MFHVVERTVDAEMMTSAVSVEDLEVRKEVYY